MDNLNSNLRISAHRIKHEKEGPINKLQLKKNISNRNLITIGKTTQSSKCTELINQTAKSVLIHPSNQNQTGTHQLSPLWERSRLVKRSELNVEALNYSKKLPSSPIQEKDSRLNQTIDLKFGSFLKSLGNGKNAYEEKNTKEEIIPYIYEEIDSTTESEGSIEMKTSTTTEERSEKEDYAYSSSENEDKDYNIKIIDTTTGRAGPKFSPGLLDEVNSVEIINKITAIGARIKGNTASAPTILVSVDSETSKVTSKAIFKPTDQSSEKASILRVIEKAAKEVLNESRPSQLLPGGDELMRIDKEVAKLLRNNEENEDIIMNLLLEHKEVKGDKDKLRQLLGLNGKEGNKEVIEAARKKFKEIDSGDGKNTDINLIKLFFKLGDNLGKCSTSYSEALAPIMAENFFKSKSFSANSEMVVPPTHFVHMDPEGKINLAEAENPRLMLGTVQEFAQGFKEVRHNIDNDNTIKSNLRGKLSFRNKNNTQASALDYCTKEGISSFQKCSLLSYLMGGIDCHLGNIMSRKDSNGKYAEFVLIDNGNSFFEKFPESKDKFILNGHYCGWADHPLSSEKIDEDVKDMLRKITPGKIVDLMFEQKKQMSGLFKVNGKDHAERFFSEDMIMNTIIRLEVMQKIILEEKKEHTLKDLAKVRTFPETNKSLSHRQLQEINHLRNDVRKNLAAPPL